MLLRIFLGHDLDDDTHQCEYPCKTEYRRRYLVVEVYPCDRCDSPEFSEGIRVFLCLLHHIHGDEEGYSLDKDTSYDQGECLVVRDEHFGNRTSDSHEQERTEDSENEVTLHPRDGEFHLSGSFLLLHPRMKQMNITASATALVAIRYLFTLNSRKNWTLTLVFSSSFVNWPT